MELDRGCGSEQQALGAGRDLPEELQEVVGLRRGECPAAGEVPAPRTVRFVQDHALEAHLRQSRRGLGVAGDQAGGDDTHPPRAAPDRFGVRPRMLDPVLVHPAAAGPDRGRQPEQGVELVLPLPEQGLGSQDQHRPIAHQGHELRRHRQLERLPEPHLVGQHEARAMRPAMRIEGELDEVLLVFPQPGLLAIDRRFHHDGRGIRFFPPAGDVSHQLAARQAVEVPNHEVRKPDRERRRPQGVELLLDPCYRFR